MGGEALRPPRRSPGAREGGRVHRDPLLRVGEQRARAHDRVGQAGGAEGWTVSLEFNSSRVRFGTPHHSPALPLLPI